MNETAKYILRKKKKKENQEFTHCINIVNVGL